MHDHVYPLPEILAAGAWTIVDDPHGGHVSRAQRRLSVPLADTPDARAVRLHELGHIAVSPVRYNITRLGVDLLTLLAVEDARVNEILRRRGRGSVLYELDDPTLPLPSPRRQLRFATLFLVAAHGTRTFDRVAARFAAAGHPGRAACQLARQALAHLTAPARAPGFKITLQVAHLLDTLIRPRPGADLPPALAALVAAHQGRRDDRGPRVRVRPRAARGAPRWGTLRRIEEPARPIACAPGHRRPAAQRASDEGAVLRAPHRLTIDGRIFARRVRGGTAGGTVLIDASGSMHPTAASLGAIVATAGALVACYEGAAAGWGAIRILARDGRRVPDAQLAGPTGRGGNVVDGPALRWLARQPGPRVWVSDGRVTGVGDVFFETLAREVQHICQAAGIVRVPKVTDVPAALRAAATGARQPPCAGIVVARP